MSELLEKILDKRNRNEAYKKVCANKDAGGADGMEIEGLDGYIRENWDSIREQIRKRSYNPQLVRRVEIAKPNGRKRKLGIPRVTAYCGDRYQWVVTKTCVVKSNLKREAVTGRACQLL